MTFLATVRTMPETLGQRIKRLRIAAGYRYQNGFARIVPMDAAALNQIEQDKRKPELDTARKLAVALGVSLDTLVGTPDPPPSPQPEPPRSTRAEAAQEGRVLHEPRAIDATLTDLSAAVSAATGAELTEILRDIAHAILVTIQARAGRHEAEDAWRQTRGAPGNGAGRVDRARAAR